MWLLLNNKHLCSVEECNWANDSPLGIFVLDKDVLLALVCKGHTSVVKLVFTNVMNIKHQFVSASHKQRMKTADPDVVWMGDWSSYIGLVTISLSASRQLNGQSFTV